MYGKRGKGNKQDVEEQTKKDEEDEKHCRQEGEGGFSLRVSSMNRNAPKNHVFISLKT